MVNNITDTKEYQKKPKKAKKSFWFEYTEKKGEDPHKSAWRQYYDDERENKNRITRYCRKCGAVIHPEGKFCERCGQRILSK
ncbi:MAG: hypothetical protein ACFFB2_11720 [Promethearchaeota archaeon]